MFEVILNEKINFCDSKYKVQALTKLNKQFKKIIKQGKDIEKLIYVVEKLANGEELELKYKDHLLQNNKYFNDCRECHIEPDWLLVYKYINKELVLLLVETGSQSEVLGM